MRRFTSECTILPKQISCSLLASLFIIAIIAGGVNVTSAYAQGSDLAAEVEKLREEVQYVGRQLDRNEFEVWTSFGVFVAAIIAIPLASYFHVRNEKAQRKSLEATRHALEADLFLRLNESLYRSNEATKILTAAVKGKPICKSKGGEVTDRELENFLNEVQTVCILINNKILPKQIAEPGFSWVIHRVKENSEIKDFITDKQKNYDYYSYGEITMYEPQEYDRAAKFKKDFCDSN